MERRTEPRVASAELVLLTVLDNPHSEPRSGRIVDQSGRGMRVALDCKIPINTPVKIESGDCIYIGVVAFCRDLDRAWHIGIQLQQQFRDTPDLVNLRRALGPSQSPEKLNSKVRMLP
jgi:hypothetical protein